MDETLLAFDFGVRRIGVAVGSTLTGGARPLATIESEANAARFDAIARLVREWAPQRLVVGRPLLEDGSPFETTARCERFARQLAGRFGLPVELVDERFSTLEARSAMAERAGGRPLRGDEPDDAEAAATILRQYLDSAGRARPGPG